MNVELWVTSFPKILFNFLYQNFLPKKMKVLITIVSSNINEVIKTTLNFFIQKLHNHKQAQNAYKQTQIKKMLLKNI